ncbi:MAG: hypothetical protein IPK85_23360 [Gemmatimonadetes bacterium]|nr:hypothetical protein [Gemmatimonadota bacterium]
MLPAHATPVALTALALAAAIMTPHHPRPTPKLGAAVAVDTTCPQQTGAAGTSLASACRSTDADPIERLQRRLAAGEAALAYDSAFGFLPALLKALEIPVSSQGLVFSRTSLQTDKIAPWSPRALYFNDDVYIGYVQEGHFLEIASMHPSRGAVFYTLNQVADKPPTFQREGRTCLMCHQSAVTEGVPGLMTLSTIADRLGYPITGVQDGAMTDATPVAQRFGGWYVTGTHGPHGHSGNVRSTKLSHEVDKKAYRAQIDLTTESERANLADYFDASVYLNGHSDVVALMVLVHQAVVHNLVTLVHRAADEADRRYSGPRNPAAPDGGIPMTPTLQAAASRLVQALFFDDAAPLTAELRGTSSFATDFVGRGPRDSQGRSLRDFDLKARLFKYPLSFLVYSDGVRTLPPVAKREVFALIAAVLGSEPTSPLAHPLDPTTRDAIRDILRETMPDAIASR